MAAKKDYFGLEYIVSLIFAIIMPIAWVCGIITRFQEGKYVAMVIRIFFGWTVVWVLDLIYMITNKEICRLLDM